jgi:hypothetical protein
MELTQILDLFNRWIESVIDRRLARYGLIPQDANPTWGSKYEAAPLAGCAPDTLKSWRDKYGWIEGVHYRRVSPNETLYNLPLMADFRANFHQQENHLAAVQAMAIALSPATRGGQVAKGNPAKAPLRYAPSEQRGQRRSPRPQPHG